MGPTLDIGGVVIIGGGGHAKVVIESLRASGQTVAAIVDADPTPRAVLG
ncbi:PglD-related sugar-binding protein, partial [Salmonella enterica]